MNTISNFSSPWIASMALSAGLIMLVAGGDFLISGAAKLARRLGMSPLLIGLTVVAFGTSMPELFVSLNAAVAGHPDIMFGNIVGSNIANIGLVLAISAIIYPLAINFKRLKAEFYLVIGASLVLVLATYSGFFPRALGLAFTTTLLSYTVLSCQKERRLTRATDPEDSTTIGPHSYGFIITLCGCGLALMGVGSHYFIDGAVDLARAFGISDLVIGLTLAAVGTSLPELASSISAIRKKEGDILVGNILGSNLFNLLLVMGVTATISPFAPPFNALSRDLPVMIGFSLILVPVALCGRQRLGRRLGVLLLSAYVGYIYLL